jgi:leucyl aminopeptidase
LWLQLVLADALTYTQKHFEGVDTIFDYATLTGACVTALGSAFAGIWCNDDTVAATISDAATSTGAEKVWRMPWAEYT